MKGTIIYFGEDAPEALDEDARKKSHRKKFDIHHVEGKDGQGALSAPLRRIFSKWKEANEMQKRTKISREFHAGAVKYP